MNKTKNMILVAFFAALTAIGAKIEIPLPFIPITLQVLFVFMAGLLLGKKLGALSQVLYVGMGLIGLPIFAKGGGPGYVFKPSFGYMIGFILAAFVIGLIVENRALSFKQAFLASIVGLLVIYACGVPYLYYILNNIMGVNITPYGAVKAGMLTFLPGDIIKILVAAFLTPQIHRRIKPFIRG